MALSACTPAAPTASQDVNTLVRQGMQTAQASLTEQAGGDTPTPAVSQPAGTNTFSFADFHIGVAFIYPPAFAEGTQAEVIPALAIQDPGDPAYPEHARIIFTGYAGESRDNLADGVRVYRTADLDAMDGSLVQGIRAYLGGTSDKRQDFPRIPGAARIVDAQAKELPFQNGKGYRFLAQAQFGATMLSSTRMFYLYEGLTADEKYLLTVVLRTDAPFVKDLVSQQPITSQDQASAHLAAVNDRLNAAKPADFSPSLDMLDALVKSLSVLEQ